MTAAALAHENAVTPAERAAYAALREVEMRELKNPPRLAEMLEALDEERKALEAGTIVNLMIDPTKPMNVRRRLAIERAALIIRIIMDDTKLQKPIGDALKEREKR
jgi:hypothetical protein